MENSFGEMAASTKAVGTAVSKAALATISTNTARDVKDSGLMVAESAG